MTSRLRDFLDQVRSSYWFLPAVMTLLALALALGVVEADRRVFRDMFGDIEWLFNNQPEGARAILSTIAGSMMTVGGVVFSLTLVTVSGAAAQYGPRLLTNYMRDSSNQFTLGMFIATFIYCLMVLRAVQSPPPGASPEQAEYFVPHLGLMLGVGLSLVAIVVLINFLNHVPDLIHISKVVARIGEDLEAHIDRAFPEAIGQPGETPPDPDTPAVDRAWARQSGYVRMIDGDRLMQLACEAETVIRVAVQPGDFVLKDDTLARLSSGEDDRGKAVADCFIIGPQRTPSQDMRFLALELAEIAARALSPGVNDPVTARSCMYWLASAQASAMARSCLPPVRADEDGAPRVIARQVTASQLLASGLGEIAPYAARDVMAANAMLDCLKRLGERAATAADTQALAELEAGFRRMMQDGLTASERDRVD